MADDDTFWSADVPVSMPIPAEQPLVVPMFGFAFSEGGIAHDITQADYARLSTPDFAPDTLPEVVYDDEDLGGTFTSEVTF